MDKKPTYKELEQKIQVLKKKIDDNIQVNHSSCESEEKFRTIADYTYDWEYWIDSEEKLIYVSPSCERITGYSVNEFLKDSKLLTSIIHSDDLEMVKCHKHNILESGESELIEFRIFTKSGEERWISHNCQTVFNKKGINIGIRGSNRNITKHKIAEQIIEDREKTLKAVLNNASDVITLLDYKSKILMINKAFYQKFGYTNEEAIKLTPMDLYTPEYAKKHPLLIEKLKREGCSIFETEYISKTGEIVLMEVSACLIDLSGQMAIVNIGRDISERKRTEEIMIKSSRLEATATIASGIAHDYNNLMVGVIGNAELLKLQFDNDHGVIDKLNTIENSARKAADLSQQLLAYSRGGKSHPKILNFNNLVQENLRINERTFPTGIRIYKDIETEPLYIKADYAQMNLVISNLCINSIEAIEAYGQIMITIRNVVINEKFAESCPSLKAGNYIYFSIKDTGCGIDKKTLLKIFEPFFSTKFIGRGLGLAAVYGIINNHNGYISVDSTVGEGSIVEIYLPAVELEKPKITPELKLNNDIPTGDETILIIDDETLVLNVTRSMLENFGYRILLAHNGQEAVNIAKNFDGNIDLALLDICMPVLGGKETFPLLKKERPHIKIIICSGYNLNEDVQMLLDTGANSFIQKPFRLDKLLREVRDILDVV